jgi:hypothetical protein
VIWLAITIQTIQASSLKAAPCISQGAKGEKLAFVGVNGEGPKNIGSLTSATKFPVEMALVE